MGLTGLTGLTGLNGLQTTDNGLQTNLSNV